MAEETDVQRGGGHDAPAEFRWHGRLHRVRAVLDHRRTRAVLPDESGSSGEAARSAAGQAASTGRQVPEEGADHEVWRVQAAIGRTGRPGVFDLRFDWNDGRWTVIRIDTLEGNL
ncbi:MAG TPA: DUF6504 family protein [Cryptosporangiaceae bacterium]|nr:DUF6504 family protein [Cryptosporangiaceae bacterium]